MNKQKGLAPILVVLFIALAVSGYLLYQKQTKPASQPLTQSSSAPIASSSVDTSNWKVYTDSYYTFKYPPSWLDETDSINKRQKLVRISFSEKNQKYFMSIGAAGRGGPPADEIKGDNPTYNGYNFSRRIWIKNGKPFFIVFIPDAPYSARGGIEFDIPQNKVQSYIEIFDQILATFKFTQ